MTQNHSCASAGGAGARAGRSSSPSQTASASAPLRLRTFPLGPILSGATCAPISLADLSAFVAHKEHTAENLLFVLWFRSYRTRFALLPEVERRGVLVPSTRLGDRYDPFGDRKGGGGVGSGAMSEDQLAAQAMRSEAERAYATFLELGGSQALGISDDLRQFTAACLRRSTAPECFLPIYEEVYHTIETQTLPHFLSYASTNINRPKKVFWWSVGLTNLLIALLLFLLPTLLLPTASRYPLRLARLPSALFGSFGAMQAYSAARGFCTQVWGRGRRQIRPWEMAWVLDRPGEASVGGVSVPTRSFRAGSEGPDADGADGGDSAQSSPREKAGRRMDSDLDPGRMPWDDDSVLVPQFLTTTGFDSPEIREKDVGSDSPIGSVSPRRASESSLGSFEHPSPALAKHLAARRGTLRIPSATLAFPIPEAHGEGDGESEAEADAIVLLDGAEKASREVASSSTDVDAQSTKEAPSAPASPSPRTVTLVPGHTSIAPRHSAPHARDVSDAEMSEISPFAVFASEAAIDWQDYSPFSPAGAPPPGSGSAGEKGETDGVEYTCTGAGAAGCGANGGEHAHGGDGAHVRRLQGVSHDTPGAPAPHHPYSRTSTISPSASASASRTHISPRASLARVSPPSTSAPALPASKVPSPGPGPDRAMVTGIGGGSRRRPSDLRALLRAWDAIVPPSLSDSVPMSRTGGSSASASASARGRGGSKGRLSEMQSPSQSASETRMPIFGPEYLVQDPSVKAAHDRVVKDILILGAGVALGFVALVCAVPMRL